MHNARMVANFDDLLSLWTAKELAEELGVKYQTAAAMRQRASVGIIHWNRLIEAAARKGHAIDLATLARLAAARKCIRAA